MHIHAVNLTLRLKEITLEISLKAFSTYWSCFPEFKLHYNV